MTRVKSLRNLTERFVGVSQKDREQDFDWWRRKAETWAVSPWAFFTAKDPDKRPLIWTRDTHDWNEPVKPFPAHLTYLQIVTEQLHTKNFVVIDKPRQVFMSTLTLLYIYWECLFGRHREWLVSKSKADEASALLKDKIRFPHSMTHPAFRALYPISATPKNVIRFPRSDSAVVGVPANLATAEARGRTASGVLIDEAARQQGLEEMIGAVLPMAAKIYLISTPALGEGASVMKEYLDAEDDPKQSKGKIIGTGISVRETVAATVIELDYWADPKKDEAWVVRERKRYTSDVRWRREYLRDWTSADGKPYYPDFSENPDRYIQKARGLIKGQPVACGWDFGYHFPAVVFGQYAPPPVDRAWVLRSIAPRDIDIHSFARLVLYCRGQLALEALAPYPKALFWLERLKADPQTPNPPWFPPGIEFRDYASHEANKAGSMGAAGADERSDGDVLRALGINLSVKQSHLATRKDVIDRLLLMRPDGPGFLVDPCNRDVIQGFSGGICYPKATPGNPNPTQPLKSGKYEHTHDCIGEWLVEEVPVALAQRQFEPSIDFLGSEGWGA